MPQITLDLDDATQALVDQAAKANGISKSRWVAEAIRRYAAHEWPHGCLNDQGLCGVVQVEGDLGHHLLHYAFKNDSNCLYFKVRFFGAQCLHFPV